AGAAPGVLYDRPVDEPKGFTVPGVLSLRCSVGLVTAEFLLSFQTLGHGLTQPMVGHLSGAGRSRPQLRLGTSFAHDARVIRALVLVVQAGQDIAGSAHPYGRCRPKLVGDGKQQRHQGLLVPGTDSEDIEADALRRGGVADDPVPLGRLEGRGDGGFGDRFGAECSHGFLLKIFTNFPNGSKNSSTTRSFSGMMALSVMVMCSGHTLVQHF